MQQQLHVGGRGSARRSGGGAMVEALEGRRLLSATYADGVFVGADTGNIPQAIVRLKEMGVDQVRLWCDVNWGSTGYHASFNKAKLFNEAGFKVTLLVSDPDVPTSQQTTDLFNWIINADADNNSGNGTQALKDYVDYWEILNEIPISTYWKGTAQQYVSNVLAPAASVLHGAGEKVIGASVTRWSGYTTYAQSLVNAGYLNHVDYANYHPYCESVTDMRNSIDAIKGVFGSKPLVLTEWNFHVNTVKNWTWDTWVSNLNSAHAMLDDRVEFQHYYRLLPGGNEGSWPGLVKNDSTYSPVQPFFDAFVNWHNKPAGWSEGNVGTPGKAGWSVYDEEKGVWRLKGGGADIWGTSDQFYFNRQSLSGDGTVIARVHSIDRTDPWSKGGVMFRDGTAANAKFVYLIKSGEGKVSFGWRSSTGGSCSATTTSSAISGPVWLKLERVGDNFTAYYSTSSATPTTWTKLGSTRTVDMANTAVAGLAVTSHNNAVLATGVFTDVSVGSTAPVATTLGATADTFAFDGSGGNDNYGTATNLIVRRDNNGYNRITYLKFDLSQVSTITSAKLRIHASTSNGSSLGINLLDVADEGWTEGGLVWNNRPSTGSTIGSVTVSGSTKSWYEIDLTSYLQAEKAAGRDVVTIALWRSSNSSVGVNVDSRETSNGARLVIS